MVVTHKMNMDLTGPAVMPKVDMVQNDQYTRQLALTLTSGGASWQIPTDAHAVICFQRADGTGGDYDVLPDGSAAWTIAENVLTVKIAPAVLIQAGPVLLAVDLIVGDSKISTFTILLRVQDGVSVGPGAGEDFSVTAYIPLPSGAEVGQYLRIAEVSENGLVLRLETESIPNVQETVDDALENAMESGSWGEVAAQSVHVTRSLTADRYITVDFRENRIQGVMAPAEDTDAANKAYVDQQKDPYHVPEYWREPRAVAAEKVRANQDSGGIHAVSFAWFSDCHIGPDGASPNSGYTGRLAGGVMEACGIPFALMTGDAARMDGNLLGTKTQMRESLRAADAVFQPIGWEKLLQIPGDYDGSWGRNASLDAPDYCYQMDGKALFGAIGRKGAGDFRRHFGGDGSYFYVDYYPAKVRFILLNSHWVADENGDSGEALHRRVDTFGYGNEQLNWLANRGLSFDEDGWAVIIAAHVPPVATYEGVTRDVTVLRGILAAFNRGTSFSGTCGIDGEWDYVSVSCDFSAAYCAEIVGFFSGHTHSDQLILEELPYPVITITSDANLTEDGRTAGTATEHAIDFVTVNRECRQVTLTRLGSGEDRAYSYGKTIANLADPTSEEWVNDSSLDASTEIVSYEGACVTNWLPCNSGDVVRIKGLDVLDFYAGYMAYDNIFTVGVECAKCVSYTDHFPLENDVISYTIFSVIPDLMGENWQGRIRFSGMLTAARPEDVVITVNQEI